MTNLPAIYIARMDVDPVGLRRFMDWYDDKHAPDTVSVGFYSAQGYHCRIGKPLIMNIYEIESSEIFYTDAYQYMRTPESDPQRPGILEFVTNRTNTVYEQVLTDGVETPARPWSEGSRTGGVTAPTVGTWRFALRDGADEERTIEWFADEALPRVAKHGGYVSARLGRRDGRPHPANPSGEPDWTLVVEWENFDSAEALGGEAQAIDALGTDCPEELVSVRYNVGVRVTSLITPGAD